MTKAFDVNAVGVIAGFFSLAIVGFGFFWVKRLEFSLGWAWWPWVALAGLIVIALSLILPWPLASAFAGSLGASVLWGATELGNQAIRVELGWYPSNPAGKCRPPLERLVGRVKVPKL